ncbi:MAG: arsinothricin resistance N-acetyltransferase ArsN1 family B [Gemmatimonadota bacterium]
MRLRAAEEQDAAGVLAIYEPVVRDTAITFELDPPTPGEMRTRIAETLCRFPWLVCEHAGEILGYAYATEHRARAAYRWCVEVSVYVHERSRRRGVARALYLALFDLLRLQRFQNAYAGITLPNPASVHLHEGLDFALVGVYRDVGFKLGAWHDVGWWALALGPAAPPEGPPLEFAKVRETPEVAATIRRGRAPGAQQDRIRD